MIEVLRSLYQCSHVRVHGEHIHCAHGVVLLIYPLEQGKPLELRICQLCADYDEMGPPIPADQRGWDKEIEPFSIAELNLDITLSNALRRARIGTLEEIIAVCRGKKKVHTIGTGKLLTLRAKLHAAGFELV